MNIIDDPIFVLVLSFVVLTLSAMAGHGYRRKGRHAKEEDREIFGVLLGANLTLLGLLIGFSFSMAINRYELRKDYEEDEANAIGTEYVRADLLPAPDAAKVKDLLIKYTRERIRFYTTQDPQELAKIKANRAKEQDELWSAILPDVDAHPSTVTALVTSGMNDVLNSQGYTQAAWWNRIPLTAWVLMAALAIFCNIIVGFGARWADFRLLLILPVTVSLSFFLISDIDSPRNGMVRIVPMNLSSFLESVNAQ